MNLLQNTIDYIRPFCRYQDPTVGANSMPILGIANLVRNIILAAPFTWAFNRNTNDSITTAVGVQDYASTIPDFGFLEKATVADTDGKLYELKDMKNNEPLAKSTTQARPFALAVQNYSVLPPSLDVVIKSTFTDAQYTGGDIFSFIVPDELSVGDTLVFALEMTISAGLPHSIIDSLGNAITQISSTNSGGGDTRQFIVYSMPVSIPGTSTITVTSDVSLPRNFLVQGVLLTGVGAIQLTSPVNNTGTGATWTSETLTTTQPYNVLLSFNVGYSTPISLTDNFGLLESGVIPDGSSGDVQLTTAALLTTSIAGYTSSWKQASSAAWQSVLVGFPINAGVGNPTPNFRFSAVPDKAYPVNIIYQKRSVQFTTTSDPWFPIPDSYSDVYNNLVMGYYMDSCQDPRAPQYIARGIAGLLARSQGLTQMDKALFAQSYMNFASAEILNQLKTQQGTQAQGSR